MKLKKVGAALAITSTILLSSNSIFASTVNIVRNSSDNKFLGVGTGNYNHSYYSYYLDDGGQVYCFFPGDTVRNGQSYEFTGEIINQPSVYYAMKTSNDTQIVQAALWSLSGASVIPDSGSLDELNGYLGIVMSQESAYSYGSLTIGDISSTLQYDSIKNAYVSDAFTTMLDDIVVVQSNIVGAYFEDQVTGNNVGTSTNRAKGEFKLVIPVDSIETLDNQININVTTHPQLGAMVYRSSQTSQELIAPYAGAGAAFLKGLNNLTFRKGDINKDGNVDQEDATIILQKFAGKLPIKGSDYVFGDMDNNGKLNARDSKLILQIGDFELGDVNRDTFINAIDASVVLDVFKNNNASIREILLGDMNEDSFLNSTDAAMILDVFKNS